MIPVSDVVDLMYARRFGKDVTRYVSDHGVFFPGVLPEFVYNLHVFVGAVIALSMGAQLIDTEISIGIRKVRGRDVPTNSTTGQMVQGGEQLGSLIGREIRRAERAGG